MSIFNCCVEFSGVDKISNIYTEIVWFKILQNSGMCWLDNNIKLIKINCIANNETAHYLKMEGSKKK